MRAARATSEKDDDDPSCRRARRRGVTSAAAADIVALTGHVTQLGAHCSALVYYIAAPDGFHVVLTTQQGFTDQAAIARFETVLAAGQSAAFSIPRNTGEAPVRMMLSNVGDHLHIAEPDVAVSTR